VTFRLWGTNKCPGLAGTGAGLQVGDALRSPRMNRGVAFSYEGRPFDRRPTKAYLSRSVGSFGGLGFMTTSNEASPPLEA
jgi:hypothetical protein